MADPALPRRTDSAVDYDATRFASHRTEDQFSEASSQDGYPAASNAHYAAQDDGQYSDDLEGQQNGYYQKKENLGSLARLVEALEDYEGAEGDAYSDVSGDTVPLQKHHRRLSSAMLSSDFNIPAKGMKKGVVPYIDPEEEDETYCAPPFNLHAPDLETPEPQTFAEDGTPIEESPTAKKFKRRVKPNWWGIICVLLFIGTFGFYIWVRATKTLGLGPYTWYGVMVLIIEIAGATTSLLWGLNIIMDPVHEPLVMDADNPGLTMVEKPYHVRVLVPCYKESLEIVGATVTASLNALLPAGCQRTIYVCDDGKDAAKRKWCRQMGGEVVYVSGRKRKPGEMNGKSANLNNCLGQIYPEGVPIPPTELVCVFDADQVANIDFFTKTLPLFDAGDDVGMVLSPQCFHNINVEADIFNHSNINFWEYAQRGYDALGFISCTGTNFLTRSSAFQQAGWSPEYTLTEDYALGMELKKRKWHCRYVEEYLAIGEAPEQVRNCFQQRSRWCKGHFQIVLSNEHCPLFQKDLSFFQRMMYCSGVWAYIVGATTTPMFIIIPLVTVWAGVFPIVVSWWAAVALTAYMAAQFLVLNYCRNRRHLKPLWFNTVANNILWWTFVKGCWRALGSTCGKALTFKTTIKGGSMLMKNGLGDLWMPCLCFCALLASLGFGIKQVVAQQTIITTLTLSLIWIVYSLIPQYLLIHYTWIGRGTTLRLACKVGYWLSTLAALAAVILLWLVYPTDYNYGSFLGNAQTFYDAMRLGQLPANNNIPWRQSALVNATGPRSLNWTSIAGGMMTGGIAGDLTLTIPTAFATSFLAWGMLDFAAGYNSSKQMQHGQDSLRWMCDYLLKTYKVDAKTSTARNTNYNIIYQSGNYTAEQGLWDRPENLKAPRPSYYISTYDGASDLAGQMAAAFASSAMVFQRTDPAYYDTLMTAATQLYAAGTASRQRYTFGYVLPCSNQNPQNVINAPANLPEQCKTPWLLTNGSMVYTDFGSYNSTSYLDDLAWAAAWLYKATGDPAYSQDAYRWFNLHLNSEEATADRDWLVDWDNLIWPASVLMAELTDDMTFHSRVQDFLQKWLCTTDVIVNSKKGRTYNLLEPSLSTTMNAAMLSLIYGYAITPKTDVLDAAKYSKKSYADRYICWAQRQARYVVGDYTRSYIVGVGKNPPKHVQERASSCPNPPKPCNAVNALYQPGPNPHTLTGALVYGPGLNGDYFQDQRTGNATIVGIEYNAGMTSVMAGLAQNGGSYDLCLQGFGVLSKQEAVCAGNSVTQ